MITTQLICRKIFSCQHIYSSLNNGRIKYMLLLKLEITLQWYNILQWYIYTHTSTHNSPSFSSIKMFQHPRISQQVNLPHLFSRFLVSQGCWKQRWPFKIFYLRYCSFLSRLVIKHFTLKSQDSTSFKYNSYPMKILSKPIFRNLN